MNIKSGMPFSQELFKNPPKDCEVTYSWSWNAPITRKGIDERLDEFCKAGIKSLYILPFPKDFRPETLRTFLDPEYLTDDFFELVSYALRRAKELGIGAWIYDEGGWPSGGACGNTRRENPEADIKMTVKKELILHRGEQFAPTDGFIALFDGKKRLPDNFTATDDITVTVYYFKKTKFNGNRVDNTAASVTDTFIKNTYERYKAFVGDMFGEDIPLIFTDEPGLQMGAVAYNEFELFVAEYGYDLRDFAYVLTDGGALAETEEEKRARIDHFVLLGKLFRENTCKKLSSWCEKNSVYYSGHLDLDNRPWGAIPNGYFSLIDLLRTFHVPGIDVIWEQIRYPYGGRAPLDDETLGIGFFTRLAPSAARQAGRNLALTETFSIYGDGVTPDEIKFVINYQAIRGINTFNFLTLPYGKSRCSTLMMRPSFTPEKPGFYNLKHINEYYARLSYLTRLGRSECDCALYHPCRDYAASPGDSDRASVSYKALGTELEERGVYFDIIDDYAILDAKDTGDGLAIGDALYRHIAVPENKYMPYEVKNKIAPYIGYGTPLYTPKNKELRFMKRLLDDSTLWFVFNESCETISERLDISGGKRIYRLDIPSGEIYSESYAEPTLLPGDIAVYLITDRDYSALENRAEFVTEIGGFKITGYDRFFVEHYGICKKHYREEPEITEDFSGTVYYEAEYSLPFVPRAEESYRIFLDGFSVSATVSIDDVYACDLGMSPMQATVPDGLLKKNGKITIALSNTAANEIVRKKSFIEEIFPPAEVGDYAMGECGEMPKFERRRPPLAFGKVKIERLI